MNNKIVNIQSQASRGMRAFLQMIDNIWDEKYKEHFEKQEDWKNYVDFREIVNSEEINDKL